MKTATLRKTALPMHVQRSGDELRTLTAPASKKTLTIGLLAGRAGVGVETVRFYERQGLIAQPPRRPSGYREYPEEVVARLGFIRRTKELGFTLQEIKELLALRLDPATSAEDVRQRVDAKIAAIEGKIRSLQKMKKALAKLTGACKCRGTSEECPLLHALDREFETKGEKP